MNYHFDEEDQHGIYQDQPNTSLGLSMPIAEYPRYNELASALSSQRTGAHHVNLHSASFGLQQQQQQQRQQSTSFSGLSVSELDSESSSAMQRMTQELDTDRNQPLYQFLNFPPPPSPEYHSLSLNQGLGLEDVKSGNESAMLYNNNGSAYFDANQRRESLPYNVNDEYHSLQHHSSPESLDSYLRSPTGSQFVHGNNSIPQGRKKRNKCTPEQFRQLDAFFAKNRNPTGKIREELSRRIQMPERSVQGEFQF